LGEFRKKLEISPTAPLPRSRLKVKKALIIEGGGMRSAYASGALVALHEQGHHHFDVVVGTSAGACCAVNFIGGYPMRNFQILHDYLAGPRFIRFSKIFSRQNIVDIDFLLDEVLQNHVPLPIKEFKATPTQLFITATDCDSGEPLYFDGRDDNIIENLRASCAMPYLYRRKIWWQGRRLMDGGIAVSIPIQKALEEGCDELYVISTRPKGYRKKKNRLGWINHLFFPRYPEMVKTLNNRWQEYNDTLAWLENPPPSKKVILIRPKQSLPVTRTTRKPAKIREGFHQGYQDALEML
jgi:predicted patatin/cPLA2 family phospholipase